VPWLDHALDAVAMPAIIAGAVASAAVFIISAVALGRGGHPRRRRRSGGAGRDGLARLKSALFTGGFGNFVVALLELTGAILLSLLAILAPALVLVALALTAWLLARIIRPRRST
jgi:hypothetical protein